MQVTNTQLLLSIAIPTLAILLAFLGTMAQMATTNARINDLVNRVGSLETGLTTRIAGLEAKVDHHFEVLMQKFYDLDNRVSRIEDFLKIPPRA